MKNRFALTLMATLICSTLAMAQLQKIFSDGLEILQRVALKVIFLKNCLIA